MVSSANPKVVPPREISIDNNIISIYSFPLVILERLAIPALNAPVVFKTPITPPIIKTNIIISIVS